MPEGGLQRRQHAVGSLKFDRAPCLQLALLRHCDVGRFRNECVAKRGVVSGVIVSGIPWLSGAASNAALS
jgi:hypothetical protein